jgi:hypothetical protein
MYGSNDKLWLSSCGPLIITFLSFKVVKLILFFYLCTRSFARRRYDTLAVGCENHLEFDVSKNIFGGNVAILDEVFRLVLSYIIFTSTSPFLCRCGENGQ